MRPTLNGCAGCLMKLSGSTYQQEVSQRVEFRAVSFPSFEAAAIERESLRAYIAADQLCCSHIRLVRRQQLRLASERLQYWLRSVFRCRCSFVLLTKWWDVSVKSQKSTIPHLCLQKLSVFLRHLIYRHIFWFWGWEMRENPTLLALEGYELK